MAGFNPDDMRRFGDFNVFTEVYKQIDNHDVLLNVLYQKGLFSSASTAQPIIIRFHGGGLVAGDSLFPDFFGHWLLELAKLNGAVIVSPNYRLLPESSASDILEDLEDLWSWVQSSLLIYLKKISEGAVRGDLKRILVTGESAGGYLAIQLALNHPGDVRTFFAQYPMIALKDPWFTKSFEKHVFGIPRLPGTVVDDHLAQVKAREVATGNGKIVVTSDPKLERGPLMFCMIQHGLFRDYFEFNKRILFPIDRVEDGARLPLAGGLVWHGDKDSVVPVEGSIRFRDAVKKHTPGANLILEVRPGDHGFDATTKLSDDWVAQASKQFIAAWLAE
jgi:acetyl esterase/lipase